MQTTVKEETNAFLNMSKTQHGVDVSTHKTLGHSASKLEEVIVYNGLLSDSRKVDSCTLLVQSEGNTLIHLDPGGDLNNTKEFNYEVAEPSLLTQYFYSRDVVPSTTVLLNKFGCTDPEYKSINIKELSVDLKNSYFDSKGIPNSGPNCFIEQRPTQCELVSFTGNMKKDFIRLCARHANGQSLLKGADDFLYHRCGLVCFKSVLGKISITGLNGGVKNMKKESVDPGNQNKDKNKNQIKKQYAKKEVKSDINIPSNNKGNIKNKDAGIVGLTKNEKNTKQTNKINQNNRNIAANAIKNHKQIRPKEPQRSVGDMCFSDLCSWYAKQWPHLDNGFKFVMVRNDPVLWIYDKKWYEIGLAAEVYNLIDDLDAMIYMSNQKFPVDDDVDFYGFKNGIRNGAGHRVRGKGRFSQFVEDQVNDMVPNLPKFDIHQFPSFEQNKDDINSKAMDDLFGSDFMDMTSSEPESSENIINSTIDAISSDVIGKMVEDIIGGEPTQVEEPVISALMTQPSRLLDKQIRARINSFSNGYTIGENTDQITLSEKQAQLMMRFLSRFDVQYLSDKFIEEVLKIPFEQFTITADGAQLGNFTGINHPQNWDGSWSSVSNIVPINEADFISSFHDMMTNNQMSLEKGFVNWWSDAGEVLIPLIMAAKADLFANNDNNNGSYPLGDNVIERIGSQGAFDPLGGVNFETMEFGGELLGGARGDKIDFGSQIYVAQSDYKSDNTLRNWDLSALNPQFNTTIIRPIFGSLNIRYSDLFFSTNVYTQLSSTFKFVSSEENSTVIGPRFCPTLLAAQVLGEQKSATFEGVVLNPTFLQADSNIVFTPAYESLGALNPRSTFSSVSSANRAYTVTPYGDLSYMVFLFKLTSLYLTPNKVNLFMGCLRAVRFACMCESGNIDYFRGGWTQSNPTRYFGYGNVVPSTQSFGSTIRFVRIPYFVNNYNTPSMQVIANILKSPGGKIAFLGENGSGSNNITADTFILQLLLAGANGPNFGFGSATKNENGIANPDFVTAIDVMTLFREKSLVHIIVFMSGDVPRFKSGSIPYNTVAADTEIADITAVDVVTSVEDLIGTYIQHGFEYWITNIYNLCVSIGCVNYFNQALIFMLHNGAVSPVQTAISAFNRFDTGGLSNVSPVTTVYPTIPSVAFEDGEEIVHAFACGVELDYFVEDNANWAIEDGLGMNVPRETGVEHYVIFGFALPVNTPDMNLSFDLTKLWNNRYWLPEYLSQAYAETNRKYYYTSMFYNSVAPFITNMPEKVVSLYSKKMSVKSTNIPFGLLSVHKFYEKVTNMKIPWTYLVPTINWIMRHSSEYTDRHLILPVQRPEFLMAVSNYTSEKLTVWAPMVGEAFRTPKVSKGSENRMNNFKSTYTFELSQIINAGMNIPVLNDEEVHLKLYGSMNMCSHYLTTQLRIARASRSIALNSVNVPLTILPALRLKDSVGPYYGAHVANYSFITYDLSTVSPIAYTNVTNSSSIVVSKTLSTYMNVLSFDESINLDEADPDGSNVRTINLNTINGLFDTPVSVEEEKAGMSSQEIEAIQIPIGSSANSGGVPMSGPIK